MRDPFSITASRSFRFFSRSSTLASTTLRASPRSSVDDHASEESMPSAWRSAFAGAGPARRLAHVAVLALDAGAARRRVAVLVPHDFELDPRMDGDLVAPDAEFRLLDLRERHDAGVDLGAAARAGRIDLPVIGVREH